MIGENPSRCPARVCIGPTAVASLSQVVETLNEKMIVRETFLHACASTITDMSNQISFRLDFSNIKKSQTSDFEPDAVIS